MSIDTDDNDFTLKIERIGDMFRLLWLESVITEASLMTRNIELHSVSMNWMCFHCRSGGALPPQPKTKGLRGQCPPAKNKRNLNYQETVFLEKLYQEKQLTVCLVHLNSGVVFRQWIMCKPKP